jgi:two-component system sensor histidine kinase/response regulator
MHALSSVMTNQSAFTILIVDDNEQNRALARATLEEEAGYSVLLASCGEEAIAHFERHAPDCILLDIRMPGLDGFAVCKAIRALPGGEDTPIVFLTASRDLDTFDAALRAGGDDFLTKPFRPTALLLRVRAALRLRRAHASNREYVDLVRQQRDELMRLELQKERLMAFVVHDLKNPVSNIDLQAQLLLRDRGASADARAIGASIRDEVRSLLRLLLNLLDIGKSEEGKLVPVPSSVDLPGLVRDACGALEVRARAKNITLNTSIEVSTLNVDVDLFRRIIENLLENALRHAPEDSQVHVTASSHAAETELRVSDSGHGVATELREAIFERFVQVESQDRGVSRSGRGLGLAFCRMAVEAHGGRIWLEDGEPGAVFCMRLPNAG